MIQPCLLRGRFGLFVSIVATTVSLTALTAYPADPIGDAKKRLAEKKFAEVDSLLEPLLTQREPSAEALRLSMEANTALGNVVTAHRRATRLLRIVGEKDLDTLFKSAELAELSGARNLALTRYFSFINAQGKKDDRMRHALAYLQLNGLYPEAFAKQLKLYGANDESWLRGRRLMDGLAREGEKDKLMAVADALFANFKENWRQRFVYDRLRRASDNYDLGKDSADRFAAPFRLALKHKVKYSDQHYHFMRHAWSAWTTPERLEALFDYQAMLGAEPMRREFIGYFDELHRLETAAARNDFGKRFLALENLYSKDVDRYYDYLMIVVRRPQVFNQKEQAIVSADKVQQQFAHLKSLGASKVSLNAAIHQLHHHFLAHDSKLRVAFLRKYMDVLDNQQYRYLIDYTEAKELAAMLAVAAKHRTPQEMQELNRNIIHWHTRLKGKDAVAKIVGYYLGVYPGFDVNFVWGNLITNSLFTPDERLNMIKGVLARGGHSKALVDLAARMAKDKTWLEHAGFKAFKAELDKKPKGSDLAASTQVKLHSMKRKRNKPEPAVLETVKAFLAGYKGPIIGSRTQAKTAQEQLHYEIFNLHGHHVWDNRQAIYEFGRTWAPRLGGHDDGWYWMVRRVSEHGGSAVLHKDIVPHFIGHLKAGVKFKPPTWGRIRGAVHAKGETNAPLEPYYKDMGEDALSYLWNQRSPWDQKRDFMMAQFGKVAAIPGLEVTNNYIANEMMYSLYHYSSTTHPIPIPLTELLERALRKRIAKSGRPMHYAEARIYGHYYRSGHKERAAKHMTEYLGRLAKMPTPDRLRAIGDLYRHTGLPSDNADELKPGHRFHTILNVFAPALASMSAEQRRAAALYGGIASTITEMSRWPEDGPHRAAIDKVRQQYVNAAVDGAEFTGHFPYLVYLVRQEAGLTDDWRHRQRLLNFIADHLKHDSNWDRNLKDYVKPLATILEEKRAYESTFVFLDQVIKRGKPPEEVARKISVIRSGVASNIDGLIPVGKNDATYNLHLAAQALALGNERKAWGLTVEKLGLLPKVWATLPPEYVAWTVEQMRKQKQLKEALQFAFTILLRERELEPEVAAQVTLTKGDIYRDQENHQAARIEFDALRNHPKYRKTTAGREALIRLIDLLILTRDYASAEGHLERLIDVPDLRVQAEAYYLYAKMAFDQEAYSDAKVSLGETFKRQHDHVRARLLEGELKLKLPRGIIETEVAVGDLGLQTTAVPGRVLTLKLQDRNLSIARGGAAIPVVVTTSKGNDLEHVKLLPSANDKTLFTGTIRTTLGAVKKQSLQLELRGDDTVSYRIEPEFQKANDIDYPPKHLTVKAPARLVASAGEILSEEEIERREMERRLRQTQVQRSSRRMTQRDGRVVRPGSPIYLQVTDFDRDLSEQKDKLLITAKTSSGDVLENFELAETEPHSGVFEAQVPTSVPLPRAEASDTREGFDVASVINSTKDGGWESLADGKKPKWLEVDTMSSHVMTGAVLTMPKNPVQKLTVKGFLSEGYTDLAVFPANDSAAAGGLTVQVARDQRGATIPEIRRYISIVGDSNYAVDAPVFDRADTPYKGRNGWMTNRMAGSFYLPENQTIEFVFLHEQSPHGWQHAYLMIDGRMVLGGQLRGKDIMNRAKRVQLGKGVHRLEVLVRDHWKNSKVIVGRRLDDGTAEPLPASWFSVAESPELAEHLQPKGTVERSDNGFKLSLKEPMRMRRLRWVFEDFAGNMVAVKDMAVNGEGKDIIPVTHDFTTGILNRTLEVAPGDFINVSYTDSKFLHADDAELNSELNASYFNGEVVLAHEEILTNEQHRKYSEFQPAKRCRKGDQLMIMVTDYDEDETEQRDEVQVSVQTSAGEKLTLKALETEPAPHRGNYYTDEHSGVFMAVLRFGDKTEKDTIKVSTGDTVTVTYVDNENTAPGVPVERQYTIAEAGADKPSFLVYNTMVQQVVDKSDQAKAKLKRLRLKQQTASDMVIYRDEIVATHPRYQATEQAPAADQAAEKQNTIVSVNAPILFEMSYPRMVLHSGSVFRISAEAESERAAAAKEQRKVAALEVPMYVQKVDRVANVKGYPIRLRSNHRRSDEEMLEDGVMSAVIRLQIGSPGDVVDDLVVAEEKEFATEDNRKMSKEQEDYLFHVPTLLVSGSDTVYLTVTDGENKVTEVVKLLSDARLELMDSSFLIQRDDINLGERYYVRVTDPDQDKTAAQDEVKVKVTASSGDRVVLTLTETLAHSGVFTASVAPAFIGEPVDGKLPAANPDDNQFQVNFGDEVTFEFADPQSLSGVDKVSKSGRIFHGADSQVSVFTKQFSDPEIAVKTRFLMAEALFEMAKDHRKLKKEELASEELARGKRILEEALRDYPNTTLVAQGEFLLANLAQELTKYEEAVGRYTNVISHWPDSEYAARSQFKKAICLEKMENYEQACEEYVKLTYLYPENTLVADATIRLGNYYYKNDKFKTAGRIFYQFQQRRPQHKLAAKALFLAGQCFMKMQDYKEAINLLKLLVDEYPDQKTIRPEAMYWLGECYYKSNDFVKAYQTFKKLTWDYPRSKWAKIARGRLTEDAFQRMEDE